MTNKIFLILITFFSFSVFSQDRVKLTFAGDLMAHDINYKTEPLEDIYKGVKDQLLADDLSFINLEFPIDETRPQTSYPSFNVHPKYIEAAIDNGFDVFALGNNHTNDYGLKSVNNTIKNMNKFRDKKGIIYSGVYYDDTNDFKVETIQVKDIKIGYLSVAQFNNNTWSEVGAAKIYIADYKDPKEAAGLIDFIKKVESDYDCFILAYHGGREYWQNPSKERAEFFDKLSSAGADIVWGHHPHVLQPWKHIATESGDRIIMYSMGNFLSGQLAIVDPVEHDINFAATGFSSLFKMELYLDNGVLKIDNPRPEMIANIRNENNFFVAVNKTAALDYPMTDKWKTFYKKMFPVAENRIRKIK